MCFKCEMLKDLMENNKEQLSAFKLFTNRLETPETLFALPIDSAEGKQVALMTPKAEGLVMLAILPSTELLTKLGIKSDNLVQDFDPEKNMLALTAEGSVINEQGADFMRLMATAGHLADMMDLVSSAQEEAMEEEAEQEKEQAASPVTSVDGSNVSFIHKAPETKQ
ncbi:hypothetical protein [Vibrio phage vB_VpS_PG28]|nr:hypothetical protein [Vibrio phage vB_VpS_PG28]